MVVSTNAPEFCRLRISMLLALGDLNFVFGMHIVVYMNVSKKNWGKITKHWVRKPFSERVSPSGDTLYHKRFISDDDECCSAGDAEMERGALVALYVPIIRSL